MKRTRDERAKTRNVGEWMRRVSFGAPLESLEIPLALVSIIQDYLVANLKEGHIITSRSRMYSKAQQCIWQNQRKGYRRVMGPLVVHRGMLCYETKYLRAVEGQEFFEKPEFGPLSRRSACGPGCHKKRKFSKWGSPYCNFLPVAFLDGHFRYEPHPQRFRIKVAYYWK